MNNYDKSIAQGIVSKWYLLGCRDRFNFDYYENLKDFCLDILINQNAPMVIIPEKFMQDMAFLKELIKKAPYKINELYENYYFTYQKFIQTINDPKKFISRCSKYCELNVKIKQDLQNLSSKKSNLPF